MCVMIQVDNNVSILSFKKNEIIVFILVFHNFQSGIYVI